MVNVSIFSSGFIRFASNIELGCCDAHKRSYCYYKAKSNILFFNIGFEVSTYLIRFSGNVEQKLKTSKLR